MELKRFGNCVMDVICFLKRYGKKRQFYENLSVGTTGLSTMRRVLGYQPLFYLLCFPKVVGVTRMIVKSMMVRQPKKINGYGQSSKRRPFTKRQLRVLGKVVNCWAHQATLTVFLLLFHVAKLLKRSFR